MLFKKSSQIFLLISLVFFISLNIVSAIPYYFEQIGSNYGNIPFFYSGFYNDPWQFYQSFPYWPDTILIICLFVILLRSLLSKTKIFGEEYGSSVGGIIGLILGLSLSVYLNAIGVHAIADFGPFVLAALIITLIILIYKWAKSQEKGSMGWFLFILLLILFTLLFMFPQLVDRIPFLRYILIIVFIILILGLIGTGIAGISGATSNDESNNGKPGFFRRLFGKGKDKENKDGENGSDSETNRIPSGSKPQKNNKLTKVEIIISPISKNDTYAVSEDALTLRLFANVFEKRGFWEVKHVPFTNRQSIKDLIYDWTIGGIRSSDHNSQIETIVRPPTGGSSRIFIEVTVSDPETKQQITGSKFINLVGGNPTLEITSPVYSGETFEINADDDKDIYFNVRLDPSGYSDVKTKNVGWYIIPRMINEISKRELDNTKAISTDLQFTKSFKDLKLGPGAYTVFVAALSNKSKITSKVWWNKGDRAIATDYIFIKVNSSKGGVLSDIVIITDPITRNISKNNPLKIKQGDSITLRAELNDQTGEKVNDVIWSLYQGNRNNPDNMASIERLGEGLDLLYDTSSLKVGFYTIFALGIKKKRFKRVELTKDKDYIFIEIITENKSKSTAYITIIEPDTRKESVNNPIIFYPNEKIELKAETTPEIKNVRWYLEKDHNNGGSNKIVESLGEGKELTIDFSNISKDKLVYGDYTITAQAIDINSKNMNIVDYIWIKIQENIEDEKSNLVRKSKTKKKEGLIDKIKNVFNKKGLKKGDLNIAVYDENKKVLFNTSNNFEYNETELNKKYYIEAIFRDELSLDKIEWYFNIDNKDKQKLTSNKKVCVVEFKKPGIKEVIIETIDKDIEKQIIIKFNVGINSSIPQEPSLKIVKINDKSVKTNDVVDVLQNSEVNFGLLVGNPKLMDEFGLYIMTSDKKKYTFLSKFNSNIFTYKLDNKFTQGEYELVIIGIKNEEILRDSKDEIILDNIILNIIPPNNKEINLEIIELTEKNKGKTLPSEHFILNKTNNKVIIRELITYLIKPSITWGDINKYKIRFIYNDINNKIKDIYTKELKLRYPEDSIGTKNITCELLDNLNLIAEVTYKFDVIKLIPISPQLSFGDYELKIDVNKEVEIKVMNNDPQGITKQYAWVLFTDTRSNKPIYTNLSMDNKIILPLQNIIRKNPNPSYILRVMSLSKVFTKVPELKELEKNRWPEAVTNVILIPNIEKF